MIVGGWKEHFCVSTKIKKINWHQPYPSYLTVMLNMTNSADSFFRILPFPFNITLLNQPVVLFTYVYAHRHASCSYPPNQNILKVCMFAPSC
jgi:hypothetical protein